jgi:hypothetical protein
MAVGGRLTRPTKSMVLRNEGSGQLKPKESSSSLLSRIADAARKPGIAKKTVFRKSSSAVYAYSILPRDLSKIVREDAKGNKVVGRLVKGHFRVVKGKREDDLL